MSEREEKSATIDHERAREQHVAYVAALRDLVGQVEEIAPSAAHPDCVFVEDTAVIINHNIAVITRPGAESRRGEVDAVAERLAALGMTLHTMSPPATLDGGDVLRVGRHLFVGVSARTNREGVQFLRAIATQAALQTHEVLVDSGLHLKSVCSLANERTLLYVSGAGVDPECFQNTGVTCIGVRERLGANVLALGGNHVIVSSAAVHTAKLLEGRGFEVTVLDISELHKADGALTCPSVRIPAPESWCT